MLLLFFQDLTYIKYRRLHYVTLQPLSWCPEGVQLLWHTRRSLTDFDVIWMCNFCGTFDVHWHQTLMSSERATSVAHLTSVFDVIKACNFCDTFVVRWHQTLMSSGRATSVRRSSFTDIRLWCHQGAPLLWHIWHQTLMSSGRAISVACSSFTNIRLRCHQGVVRWGRQPRRATCSAVSHCHIVSTIFCVHDTNLQLASKWRSHHFKR